VIRSAALLVAAVAGLVAGSWSEALVPASRAGVAEPPNGTAAFAAGGSGSAWVVLTGLDGREPHAVELAGSTAGETTAVVLSPDGTRLAVENGGRIWIVDVAERRVARVLAAESHATSSISARGRRTAGGSRSSARPRTSAFGGRSRGMSAS